MSHRVRGNRAPRSVGDHYPNRVMSCGELRHPCLPVRESLGRSDGHQAHRVGEVVLDEPIASAIEQAEPSSGRPVLHELQ